MLSITQFQFTCHWQRASKTKLGLFLLAGQM